MNDLTEKVVVVVVALLILVGAVYGIVKLDRNLSESECVSDMEEIIEQGYGNIIASINRDMGVSPEIEYSFWDLENKRCDAYAEVNNKLKGYDKYLEMIE